MPPQDPAQDPAEQQPAAQGDTDASGGRDDSGRESQPVDAAAVRRSAATAERLDRQSRSFDDAAGINPDRGQDSTPEPGERDGS